MRDLDIFDSDDSNRDPNYCQTDVSSLTSDSDSTNKDEPNKKLADNTEFAEERENEHRKKKKVIKGETRRVRKDRQRKHNMGQEYITKNGKNVVKRSMRPLKACRSKCLERISEEDRQYLFKEYWNIGDYNRRVSYIAGLLEIKNKAVSRPRLTLTTKRHDRKYTVLYHFQINGSNIPTCKFCFTATFDETVRFIGTVVQKN